MTTLVWTWVLTIGGGALTVAGLGEAWWRAARRFRSLDTVLTRIEEVNAETTRLHKRLGETPPMDEYQRISREAQAKKDAIYSGTTTWGTLEYSREYAERDFLDHLRRPAWLATLGVLAGTVGACLSLTMP